MDAHRPTGLTPAIRQMQGTTSQALLVALIADYTVHGRGELPSSAIIHLLGEFGISAAGARSALSRVARRGLLTPRKSGRRTYYSITEADLATRVGRLQTYIDFGPPEQEWDGTWTVIVFTSSEDERGVRARLRTSLERSGFAPLIDAVWIKPGRQDDAIDIISAAPEVRQAAMHSQFLSLDGLDPVKAFDLDGIRGRYEAFITEFRPLLERFVAGEVGASDAMIARVRVLDAWRAIALTDPNLPHVLLPTPWPQATARGIFTRLWEASRDLSRMRVAEVIRQHSPA